MIRTSSSRLGLLAPLLALLTAPPTARASVLCEVRHKSLVVRDVCKARETPVTGDRQAELGLEGAPGPSGPPGPPSHDLRILDAASHEVGVVIGTSGYYGSAKTVGQVALPGASSQEFVLFEVDAHGLAPSTSCEDAATIYRSSDCTGQAFSDCSYGECSSVSGAFFARPVFRSTTGGACFFGDASEVERADFYSLRRLHGSSAQDIAARCAAAHGTLVGPVALCVPPKPILCAPCCQAQRGIWASPMHLFDASLLGTPPFRLAR